ncbi:MAG: hypothetical protein JNM56_40380 [Planctomycetia bacterium]|nr:hypothetical protein [Planctomycetia bacterium]
MIAEPRRSKKAGAVDRGPTAPASEGIFGRRYCWPLLLLTGYLLFAHGCHGDEDNELFARFNPSQRFNEASQTAADLTTAALPSASAGP